MPNMPDKPDTWALMLAWLSQHAPILTRPDFSSPWLKVHHLRWCSRQMIVEVLCGGLTLTIISGLSSSGCRRAWPLVGGWVGFGR